MISVLLPTFNSAETIRDSIRCILRQTVRQFELLVLDDGSTDTTADVVAAFHDPRIRYHRFPHRGLAATLNDGLTMARYDIIARMDADDLCVPERFEKQLTAVFSLTRRTIISSWYAIFDHRQIQYSIASPTDSSEIKKALLLHSYIAHPCLMCYKEVMLSNGGYVVRGEGEPFEDYETWLAIKDNVEFYTIPEFLLFHRFREHSLTNTRLYRSRTVYSIQEPYYADMTKYFDGLHEEEILVYRGWREFFYGSKNESRSHWKKLKTVLFRHPNVAIALILSLLPESVFQRMKQSRLRYRAMYYCSYFSRINRSLRTNLEELLRKDNEHSSRH